MKLKELDTFLQKTLLIPENSKNDSAINGIQVGDINQEIKKIAFAVDSGLEVIERANAENADMLFVHHGFFWGRPLAIVGTHFNRVKALVENNTALYATHLPLDMHPTYGNNIAIAEKLSLENIKPFGLYKGSKLGFKGELKNSVNIEEIIKRMELTSDDCLRVLNFGKEEIKTVAVVSGGAVFEVFQAIDEDVDLYITGDAGHEVYHNCKESCINMISAGHYNTEVFGVQRVAKMLEKEFGIETVFIDAPSNL